MQQVLDQAGITLATFTCSSFAACEIYKYTVLVMWLMLFGQLDK